MQVSFLSNVLDPHLSSDQIEENVGGEYLLIWSLGALSRFPCINKNSSLSCAASVVPSHFFCGDPTKSFIGIMRGRPKRLNTHDTGPRPQ